MKSRRKPWEKLRIGLQITNYKLQIINYKLRIGLQKLFELYLAFFFHIHHFTLVLIFTFLDWIDKKISKLKSKYTYTVYLYSNQACINKMNSKCWMHPSELFIHSKPAGKDCLEPRTMVLISDGNSEIGVHERSNLCYLICVSQLIWSRAAVTNRIFFFEKSIFFLLVNIWNNSQPIYEPLILF